MWSYDDATGPEFWGSLSPEFAACSLGMRQSPINLVSSAIGGLASSHIALDYRPVDASVAVVEFSVQVSLAPGCAALVDGDRYDLSQFHFHTPGEHTVDSHQSVAEMHLVHFGPRGELAVVGVLIELGGDYAALDGVFEALATSTRARPSTSRLRVDPSRLVPAPCRAFQYDGSRTMPPCEEGVRWTVVEDSIEIGVSQIAALVGAQGQNSRPVQPWNGRSVGVAEVDFATWP